MVNAKRAEALPTIPPYSTDLVRTVLREIQHLETSVQGILAPYQGSFNAQADPEIATRLIVEHMCMRRDKRCLLAYHKARCAKIEEEIWAGKDVLSSGSVNAAGTGEGEGGLSPEEEEYARQYADLLAAYKGRWTDIDLTGSLEPPRELFIDVRVMKDAGEIQTEYGYVDMFIVISAQMQQANARQRHHFDQGLTILCSTRRCRATDTARLLAEAFMSSPFLQDAIQSQWSKHTTEDCRYRDHAPYWSISKGREMQSILPSGLRRVFTICQIVLRPTPMT